MTKQIRYLTAVTSNVHYLSSPVTAAAKAVIGTTAQQLNPLTAVNEAISTATLTPGRGYSATEAGNVKIVNIQRALGFS